MTIPEKAAEFARNVALDDSHGYDQGNRWGPDYDCSSLCIAAYKHAGVPLTCTYTGNMRSDMLQHGFAIPVNINLTTGAGLQTGDVLLNEKHHAAMYVGSGKIVNAGGNEHGGITGGLSGDQNGREIQIMPYYYSPSMPWEYVLRYVRKEEPEDEPDTPSLVSGDYIVEQGDTLWGIADKLLGNGARFHEIMDANGLTSILIKPGQALKIPGGGNKTFTATVTVETYAVLLRKAEEQKKTIGQIIDGLV